MNEFLTKNPDPRTDFNWWDTNLSVYFDLDAQEFKYSGAVYWGRGSLAVNGSYSNLVVDLRCDICDAFGGSENCAGCGEQFCFNGRPTTTTTYNGPRTELELWLGGVLIVPENDPYKEIIEANRRAREFIKYLELFEKEEP